MTDSACSYREKLETILNAIEANAKTWAFLKIQEIPIPVNYISPEAQKASVLYYQKYAAEKIVKEICDSIRNKFDGK